jgi:hypothetical protein
MRRSISNLNNASFNVFVMLDKKNKKYLSDLKDFQLETNCTPSHSTMHGNIAGRGRGRGCEKICYVWMNIEGHHKVEDMVLDKVDRMPR